MSANRRYNQTYAAGKHQAQAFSPNKYPPESFSPSKYRTSQTGTNRALFEPAYRPYIQRPLNYTFGRSSPTRRPYRDRIFSIDRPRGYFL